MYIRPKTNDVIHADLSKSHFNNLNLLGAQVTDYNDWARFNEGIIGVTGFNEVNLVSICFNKIYKMDKFENHRLQRICIDRLYWAVEKLTETYQRLKLSEKASEPSLSIM